MTLPNHLPQYHDNVACQWLVSFFLAFSFSVLQALVQCLSRWSQQLQRSVGASPSTPPPLTAQVGKVSSPSKVAHVSSVTDISLSTTTPAHHHHHHHHHHIRCGGGGHPPNPTILGKTLCKALLAPAREGRQGAEAALVSRGTTVPLQWAIASTQESMDGSEVVPPA